MNDLLSLQDFHQLRFSHVGICPMTKAEVVSFTPVRWQDHSTVNTQPTQPEEEEGEQEEEKEEEKNTWQERGETEGEIR